MNKPWTKGPWILRTHPMLPTFIEAPRSKTMAYSLDVCGDDYTGYGDEEQREINMRLIVLSPLMADYFLDKNLTDPDAIKIRDMLLDISNPLVKSDLTKKSIDEIDGVKL